MVTAQTVGEWIGAIELVASVVTGLASTRYHGIPVLGMVLRFLARVAATTPPDAHGTFKIPGTDWVVRVERVKLVPPLPVIILLGALLAGCPVLLPPQSGCRPDDTRCFNGRPQVCSESTRWHNADRKCAELEAVCCKTISPYGGHEIHACSRPQDCLGADGGDQ